MKCSKCGQLIEDDKFFLYNMEPTHIICESEKRIYYDQIPKGSKIKIETQNSIYILKKVGYGNGFNTLINGGYFEKTYGKPMKVRINGCTWGGSMLKIGVIEVNMILEIIIEEPEKRIGTSWIKDIEVLEYGQG
jgi:hypothetical protein